MVFEYSVNSRPMPLFFEIFFQELSHFLRRVSHGLYAISVAPHGQPSADGAVVDLLQLAVNVDDAVCGGDRHDEVAHAVVDLLTYELGHDEDEFVGLLALHRLDAVVLEGDGQRQHVGVLDAQHLRAAAHVYPVLAGLEFGVADDVTLEAGTHGSQLHLDEGTGLAVDVLAFILTGGDVHGCCCHGRDGELLCHETHDGPAQQEE